MAITGDRKGWLGGALFGGSAIDSRTIAATEVSAEPTHDNALASDSPVLPRVAGESDPGPDAVAHARRLLEHLQRDSRRCGTVPAVDVMRAYDALVLELGWQRLSWTKVARRFGKLTAGKAHRTFVERGISRRLLCYEIPSAGAGDIVTASRKRAMPLPARLAALEVATAGLSDRVAQLTDLLELVVASSTAPEARP